MTERGIVATHTCNSGILCVLPSTLTNLQPQSVALMVAAARITCRYCSSRYPGALSRSGWQVSVTGREHSSMHTPSDSTATVACLQARALFKHPTSAVQHFSTYHTRTTSSRCFLVQALPIQQIWRARQLQISRQSTTVASKVEFSNIYHRLKHFRSLYRPFWCQTGAAAASRVASRQYASMLGLKRPCAVQ